MLKRDAERENAPTGADKFVKRKDAAVLVQRRRAGLRAENYQQGRMERQMCLSLSAIDLTMNT